MNSQHIVRVGPAVVGTTLLDLARCLAFWATVLVPVVYLPVLYGVVDVPRLEAVLALLCLNVCCLIAGQEHEP